MLQIPLRKLDRLTPEPTELDRYEIASRDEIRALQRERLAWSLRHAYENVPHYRAKFDAAGVTPGSFKDLPDLAKFPFTIKTDL
ncbi:MAG: phenylacetate--CoA ligase, partial [Afipia sp.]|nr:phenylacetate--CoA ligase [Afipia sp.]